MGLKGYIFILELFKLARYVKIFIISIYNIYICVGALKTDFTRTGQRTKMGLLEDGRRSVIRYFKNNFADGFRQVR